LLAEILEIRVVRHVLDADVEPPIVAEVSLLMKVDVLTSLVGLVVVLQIFAVQLPRGSRHQVAKLVAHLDTALAHVAWLHGVVEVRRDVDVIRHRQVEPGAVVLADGRDQKTGLALVVDREREVRRVEDRHAFEIELHAVRGAEPRIRVELDVARVQFPRRVVDRAGREQHFAADMYPAVAAD
jgi:hypothetical protein